MKTSTKTLIWIVGVSTLICVAATAAFNWDSISNSVKEKRLQRQIRQQTSSVKYDSTRVDNIHNIILIDESGSMSSMREETIEGAHETVLSIAAVQDTVPELKQYLTAASFCGDNLLELHYSVQQTPLSEVTRLSSNSMQSDAKVEKKCATSYLMEDMILKSILPFLPIISDRDEIKGHVILAKTCYF